MGVDKNLFLYDLAVVAIMKNEAPYVKEWLDYHLLAGVDHFFIYDNGSEDNLEEVLQPYIDAELVTYIDYPGKGMQMDAYNDAIENFKFYCRYMAFIDADEFIFPRSGLSIPEMVDDFLLHREQFGGLEISWLQYGSNGQKTADLTRGVLERFTLRKSQAEKSTKPILNPRQVDYMWTPHFAVLFGNVVHFGQNFINVCMNSQFNLAKLISINHYVLKSFEEFVARKNLGSASCGRDNDEVEERFKEKDANFNDVFDDSIVKYRDTRKNALIPADGDIIETFAAMKRINYDRLVEALSENLMMGFTDNDTKIILDSPKNRFEYFSTLINFFDTMPNLIFVGRTETFLTSLALSTFLKETFLDEELGNLFEEFSLKGVLKSFDVEVSENEIQLLLKEMPKILVMPYPVVHEIRNVLIEKLVEVREVMHAAIDSQSKLPMWKDILDLDYKIKMLRTFDNYHYN